MIDFDVKVTGMLTFAKTKDVQQAISRGIRKAGQIVANQARQNADGRPGPIVRTGRLRSSITGQVSGDGFSAVIGSNVEYAPRIEMGYRGPEGVRAHARTIRQAFGRSISPRDVQVSAFTRQANAPAYPFLRPAVEYAQRIHIIEDILQREIDKVTQ